LLVKNLKELMVNPERQPLLGFGWHNHEKKMRLEL
jgi:hypothetical protein